MSLAHGIRTLSGAAKAPPIGRSMAIPKTGAKYPTHPLVGADVGKISRILLDSEQGSMAGLMDLYEDMRERDGRLDAVCRTRTLALAGKDWTIAPPKGLEDDADAARAAEGCQEILCAVEEFDAAIAHLMDGVLRSYSVVEIVWGRDRKGRSVPKALVWRHPGRFNFDKRHTLVRYDSGDPFPGVPLEDDKFIVHAEEPSATGSVLGAIGSRTSLTVTEMP